MLLERFFRPRSATAAGRALYAAAVARSRNPALYGALAAPDTVEGRFEIYTLHVVLLLDRLRGQGAAAADVSQALFDTYVKALDHALREMGVGDLSVGKKMRRLGEAFYGRVKSYAVAFESLPDVEPLRALLVRTVYAEAEDAPVDALIAHVLAERDALLARPTESLVAGDAGWVAP
ncbi:MAG: ubiquinol-cytochrome C chaperone family protein [Phenylobacterium sp.]|uniref:ubiquinol-cytochrome C chaperone family protein n=1 Tax=Phenylobacterium sp. TaxID=1871053 RepID=UPI0027369AC2|nr:ubiquinol-cytochrome C chaperone family protein [Phenylobacterium sp.]MDP3174852.1 ubiquinol-cytochrome C chaperone family protein [Phenylobacterium sp.]